MIESIIFVALLAAFMVLLLKKWGVTEWMQVHGDSFSSKLFSCDLCMSFWAAVVVCVVLVCVFENAAYLLLTALTTPITRMML